MSDVVHICFITDEGYVTPTVVAIKSLLDGKSNGLKIEIHILASNLSKDSIYKLKKCCINKCSIDINEVNDIYNFNNLKIENLHVSTSALFKFLIPDIFKDIDKILYLDGDIIVKGDIGKIWNENINGVYAAVVKDMKAMTYNPPQTQKLKINHTSYFNTGVILYNLKKMREDNICKELIEYRKNGKNYFMDQDAFNVVLKEKVKYLPFEYNVISSVMGYFKIDEIIRYYDLKKYNSKNDINDNALIIHLASPYKPWNYSNVPFSNEWYSLYRSVFDDVLERSVLDSNNKAFNELGYQKTPKDVGVNEEVCISIASYPKRINFLKSVLHSLLIQTVLVDKIVVVLNKNEFPHEYDDLPEDLVFMCNKFSIISIVFMDGDDIGPHKKYYYSFKKFPNSIIITFDDDVFYDIRTVENLLKTYVRFPYAVSASRVHLINTDKETKNISPYNKWIRDYGKEYSPSLALMATGVGGVLYPPSIIGHIVFDYDRIINTCKFGDDLWLKFCEVLSCVPVVKAKSLHVPLKFIDGSQEEALWKNNVISKKNDIMIKNIINSFEKNNKARILNLIDVSRKYFTRAQNATFDAWYDEFGESYIMKKNIKIEDIGKILYKNNKYNDINSLVKSVERKVMGRLSYRVGNIIVKSFMSKSMSKIFCIPFNIYRAYKEFKSK